MSRLFYGNLRRRFGKVVARWLLMPEILGSIPADEEIVYFLSQSALKILAAIIAL